MKYNVVPMILVGGRGTRLKSITNDTAKPAVDFGGKYKIIDFVLSNLTNSYLDTCGIVTQYEPYELMNYIGHGESWDLDTIDGGVSFLTPYTKYNDIIWQKGTANAILQHFYYIDSSNPDCVLILSGDHIYKMNYQNIIDFHMKNNADITISAINVNQHETSRFGILNIDENNRVSSFVEKPKESTSTLASMGIYVFKTSVLKKLLLESKDDDVDFGHDIIPKSIMNHYFVYGYQFNGYWRDVGTVQSLYEANMELLYHPEFIDLDNRLHMPIYSKSSNLPPHFISKEAVVKNAIIGDGASINGNVFDSVISLKVFISNKSIVKKSVILPGVRIGKNCILNRCVVNKNVIIPDNFIANDHHDLLLIDHEYIKRWVGDNNG